MGALVVALGLELLLILVLLGLGLDTPKPLGPKGVLSVSLLPDTADEAEAPKALPPKAKAVATTPAPPTLDKAPPLPKPIVKLPSPAIQPTLPILVLNKKDLAAADISKLGTHGDAAGTREGEASASAPGDSQPVGTAPNGEPLYNAEWQREPSDRELGGYLPTHMPEGGGWGMVACRTAPRNRVEDCVELGNGPTGSHLASAVRQAAWQFLVRPPRKGGRALIGGWVRIRIDYVSQPVP